MANTASVGRQLVQVVIQGPSTRNTVRHLPCYHPHPKDWVRTITSSSTRYKLDTPGVSFGEGNDEVIAPYVEKLNKKPKARKKKTSEPNEPVACEEYEIGGFIDRSRSTKSKAFLPIEEKLGKPSDEVVAVENVGTGRNTRRSRNSDNNSDDKQVTSKHDWKSPKAKMQLRRVEHDFDKIRRVRVVPLKKYNIDVDTKHQSMSGRPLEKKKVEGVEQWATQKNALKEKFKEGWQPRKKLSPDAMEGIRALHDQDPVKYSTELLAEQFQMSPEAIRRILKSKWLSRQSPEKLQERRERWAKRHDRIWDAQAELGLRPPRRKDKEIEDPDKFEQDLERRRILGEI